MDVVITCAAYFIADIDGEWDSYEVETFVAFLAKTAIDGISLGVSIYNFSKMQKAILTNIDDGATINVSVGTQTLKVKNVDENCISGKWTPVNESMSEFSRTYQTHITGKEGQAFVQNGVKFDGVLDGCLVETKGKYAQFVSKKTGEFYEWFSGQKGFVDQAIRQLKASDGAQICWYFAEETAMEATRKLFSKNGITNIKLIFAPLG